MNKTILDKKKGTYKVECANGDIEYFNKRDELHNEDGPAIEDVNGDKLWYQNGLLHREDGPAVEDADGDKEWYQNGERHRLDGPAVEDSDGYEEYWVDGKELSEEEFNKEVFGIVEEDWHSLLCKEYIV